MFKSRGQSPGEWNHCFYERDSSELPSTFCRVRVQWEVCDLEEGLYPTSFLDSSSIKGGLKYPQDRNSGVVIRIKRYKWKYFVTLFFKLLLLFCHAACEILVPQPGIKPVPPAVKEVLTSGPPGKSLRCDFQRAIKRCMSGLLSSSKVCVLPFELLSSSQQTQTLHIWAGAEPGIKHKSS